MNTIAREWNNQAMAMNDQDDRRDLLCRIGAARARLGCLLESDVPLSATAETVIRTALAELEGVKS